MAVKWTKEQKQVIALRNRSILVSAAAGSGKTAVLVERIISQIMDASAPADIDRFLIVTFTRAAAAQMRERIREEIERLVLQADGAMQAHLVRQLSLISNAQITTIDSFCNFIVRNYFHKIDLEPNFRIGENGELTLLKEEALSETLEEAYVQKSERFVHFVECYVPGKNESALGEMVLQLFGYAMSHPWPKQWLDECKKPYDEASAGELGEQGWFCQMKETVLLYLSGWIALYREAYELCVCGDGPEMYEKAVAAELAVLEELEQETDFFKVWQGLAGFSFGRLGTKRNYDGSKEKQELVKQIRNEVKGQVKKIQEQLFSLPPERALEKMLEAGDNVRELVMLTSRFMQCFEDKKREAGVLDFADIEHLALKILVEEDGTPSEAAKEISGQINEIMIDEYQDSNDVQEAILSAVSRRWSGQENVFMVGDVKQSIYRFRQARPELFMEKYDTYTKEDGLRQKVILMKNFRSRAEVLDFTNDAFRSLMSKDMGNIAYDDDAALYAGSSYPAGQEGEFIPQLILVDPKDEEEEFDKKETEAQAVADEIKRIVATGRVTDGADGSLRPAAYSDIVILLRSLKGTASVFAEVLKSNGIPVRTTMKNGYFTALEIKTVLNLLRLIDNPHQDIAFAAVLHSPIVGLDSEELALIRTEEPDGSFYGAVGKFAAREGDDHPLRQKLRRFLADLERFRDYREYESLYHLLERVLDETGYLDYAAALPGGKQRVANIRLLMEQAVSYEKSSYRSLFRFIHYIDKLEKYEVDLGEVGEGAGEEDAVTIMSIHKSKGLEFPVVFLSGLGKRFNKQDLNGKLILHPDYGIGLDYIDLQARQKSATIMKSVLSQVLTKEGLGEELRVLYVALTRAKEKLILTGTLPGAQDVLEKLWVQDFGQPLFFSRKMGASTYLDWLLPVFAALNGKYPVRIVRAGELHFGELVSDVKSMLEQEELHFLLTKKDEAVMEEIKERFEYVYPYGQDIRLRTKMSVSELKHRAIEQSSDEEIAFAGEKMIIPYLPKFMETKQEENRGALRGSAVHRVMECFDFTQEYKEGMADAEIKKMQQDGRLGKEAGELVAAAQIEAFLKSSLAKRMQEAAVKNNLFIEQPFVMGRPAGEIETTDSNEKILIQGIIDVFWEEEDGLVLIDYKTDHVPSMHVLLKRYESQLKLYAQAAALWMERPVKEAYIYSFCLGEAWDIFSDKK